MFSTFALLQLLLLMLRRPTPVSGDWLQQKWMFQPPAMEDFATPYRDDKFSYYYAWRSLTQSEIGPNGNLALSEQQLCKNIENRYPLTKNWKPMTVSDAGNDHFVQFLQNRRDFLPFTAESFTVKHIFSLMPLKVDARNWMKATLTVGTRFQFDVNVYAGNETIPSDMRPFNLLCLRKKPHPVPTAAPTLPPKTTTPPPCIPLSSASPISKSVASMKIPHTPGAVGVGNDLDRFLVDHRATLFAVTACSIALLLLLGILLACISRRYRSLSKRGYRSASTTMNRSQRSPDGISGCSSATAPLWPRNCTTSSSSPGDSQPQYLQPQHIRSQSNGKVVHVPSEDAELGAIAARRFRDTLRRSEHAGINGAGAQYSTLHQSSAYHGDTDRFSDPDPAIRAPKTSTPAF